MFLKKYINYIISFVIGIIIFISMFYLGFNVSSNNTNFKNANLDIQQNSGEDVLPQQFSHLSLGGDYSGVVFTDEKGNEHLYMWGSNLNGRLGDGTYDNSSVPIEIDPDGTSNRDGTSDGIQGTITNLSFSPNHSGVVINDNNGIDHLYMWGRNNYGQLGNNSTTTSNVPIEIDPDGNSDGTPDGIQGTITNLSLGDYHSGVVINDDNGIDHLYMWGKNNYGQLGNNSTTDSMVPIEIDPDGTSNRDGTSDGIQGTVTNLSLGSNNSGIVIQTGEIGDTTDHLYMWGKGAQGQIGNGSNSSVSIPTEINVDGDDDGIQGIITNFAVGVHSGVVIKDEGGNDHLYMWGRNNEGQLGDGTNNNSNLPIEINVDEKTAGGDAPGIQGTITNLSVEKNFTGTVINDNNGVDHLYMWGENEYRQLGNDSDVNSNIPIEINVDEETPGGDAPGIQGTITNISFGWYHSGVVIQDKNGIDHLYMWGKGDAGQLGNENTTMGGVPIEITPALIIGETTIASSTEDGKAGVTINWDGEQNSANSIDKLELIGTDVNGDGATSVDLLNNDNSNFQNGSYFVNLEYGTYNDWQINYSTNFGYGTVNIKPFTSLEKASGIISNISILDINYIDKNNINATFGLKFDFKGTTEIKDSKITISGDNFTEQTVVISEKDSFSIDIDYGTKYDLTVNYNLVTETDQIGTKGTPVKIPPFETVEHVKAPTINSVSIDEESITATTAILNYSINIFEGDGTSTQNTIITKIEVKDGDGTSYGFIDNKNDSITEEGYIELSGLIPEQSYNDLYIVITAEGEVSGEIIIVNEDDLIEEGHIGGFQLSISMIILYSALLIFAIGSIIGLIIGLTWYFIRRKKSSTM